MANHNTEIVFSAVKNARKTATYDVSLADVFKEITGPNHAASVAQIREHFKAGRDAKAEALKKALPGYMFSGTFTKRNNASIRQHSGLLVIDFDDCDTERKSELAADPHALLAFVSPSGKGLKLVIRVEADPARHRDNFEAARVYFQKRFGLIADLNGRDLVRLCFVSHDPTAILNPSAEVLQSEQRITERTEKIEDNRSKGGAPKIADPDSDPDQANHACPILASIQKVLTATQPTAPGQRNRKIFDLARGLRFDCGLADKPFSELKPIVQMWYDMAKATINTQNFTDTWIDFVNAWPQAKLPLSENRLTSAWEAAKDEPRPPEAAAYDHENVQLLVALCWQLSRPSHVFFLSMHSAAKLFNCQPEQIRRWLIMLQADNLLTIIKKGNRQVATRYAWAK